MRFGAGMTLQRAQTISTKISIAHEFSPFQNGRGAAADSMGAAAASTSHFAFHPVVLGGQHHVDDVRGCGAGLGQRRPLPYAVLGIALWVAVLKSGVHATIAGVVLAMTIPATARLDLQGFIARAQGILDEMREPVEADDLPEEHTVSAHELEQLCERVESPLQRLEHMLQPWVAFFIMPIFALANAGVALGGSGAGALLNPVALGVALGLVGGKLVGVLGFSWLAVKTGVAQLPSGVTWRHIFGASWLCGIGFTMSLFIANLAFDAALLDTAKIGILAASLVAGIVGFAVLRALPPSPTVPEGNS